MGCNPVCPPTSADQLPTCRTPAVSMISCPARGSWRQWVLLLSPSAVAQCCRLSGWYHSCWSRKAVAHMSPKSFLPKCRTMPVLRPRTSLSCWYPYKGYLQAPRAWCRQSRHCRRCRAPPYYQDIRSIPSLPRSQSEGRL